ncbi:MAG: radical SAM protein [Candidatus Omnitrophica bacterium]|nr:radical SAM protein [Candidatus Omnitrophota bacterium]
MYDIILINPKSNTLQSFDFLIAKSIPLSIGYIASYLEDKNYNVKIIDEEVEMITKEKLLQMTNNKKQLFGVSCLTPTISRGYKLANLIKSIFPESTIVFGGIHCTVLPEEVLGNPCVDLVVRGEGEPVIEQIVLHHRQGKNFKDILSCSYRSNGTIIHNPIAPLIDINSLPSIPFHMFDSKIYDMGFMISSRGCPYNCAFCSQRIINGNVFRYRSTEKVIAELQTLTTMYQPSNIVFLDDIFTVSKTRVRDLCQAIIQNNLHTKAEYSISTRGDCIDDEILKELRSANFTGLNIGVETASEKLMKFINKNETVSDIVKGIQLAKKYNFGIDTTFIYGIPGETRADRVASFNLAVSLSPDKARFNNATPYPGTKFYDVAKRENNLNIIGHWENFTPTGVLASNSPNRSFLPYYPQGSTPEEIIEDVIQANMLYFLQPKRLKGLIKNMFDRKGTKWFVLPNQWWKEPKYIKGLFLIFLLTLKRLILLIKWGLQGKLLTQFKKKKRMPG